MKDPMASMRDQFNQEYPPARASGRTFRTLLKAFLTASEAPGRAIFIVSEHQPATMHAFTKASDMFCHSYGFIHLGERQRINLPNGSYVCFISRENYEIQEQRNLFRSLKDCQIFRDDND
jgi:hypothetical protein